MDEKAARNLYASSSRTTVKAKRQVSQGRRGFEEYRRGARGENNDMVLILRPNSSVTEYERSELALADG